MAKSIETYREAVISALRSAGAYSDGLGGQIEALATALRTLDLANADIDGLETTTVMEVTRYGNKIAPHPVFKIARDAQDQITRQMKALGLTAGQLTAGDGLSDLLDQFRDDG